ncbi:MAG: phosphoribosylformylglycinamidine cyclo-ligase [Candidatus Levybacteria bacterium]|nr:phosphoribosylformylglycinamidine cyclo-ligase [Candidatus Levybacteria bacterium]
MAGRKITYSTVGENYEKKDPIKKLAQVQARLTSKNIFPFKEIPNTRGESAYVWEQSGVYMAAVIEGLGTKNLIADEMMKLTGKDYYENIAHDTVASTVNDLITVGARPLVVHAFWAVGSVNWVADERRIKNLITGWKKACDLSLATWGGGESPTLRDMIDKSAIVLGGSCVGIIGNKKRLISERKLKVGDRIVLIKSSGPNANAISLIRAVAKKLKKGYLTKLSDGKSFGEEVLAKTNIYASLVQDLLNEGIDIHYIANITGHGLRKIMRSRRNFTYVIKKLFSPQELFNMIQRTANLSDKEMYGTFNMGQDYAIFVPQKDVEKTLRIIRKNKFQGIKAGIVEKGKKQVIVKQKNIVYSSKTLNLR